MLTIANNLGIVAEQSFDAWGRRRNPTTYNYTSIPATPEWLWRGYTGHEMLDELKLINMNARLYDPITARMLGPDNYVQSPFNTQNYNRYSYVLNNPLSYTDPSGNFFFALNMLNEAANWGSEKLSGNSDYSFDWNYVATGQLPNHWSNDPSVITGENGYPIGPFGEYTAFGDYGRDIDTFEDPRDFVDASGQSYTLEMESYLWGHWYREVPDGENYSTGEIYKTRTFYKPLQQAGTLKQTFKSTYSVNEPNNLNAVAASGTTQTVYRGTVGGMLHNGNRTLSDINQHYGNNPTWFLDRIYIANTSHQITDTHRFDVQINGRPVFRQGINSFPGQTFPVLGPRGRQVRVAMTDRILIRVTHISSNPTLPADACYTISSYFEMFR